MHGQTIINICNVFMAISAKPHSKNATGTLVNLTVNSFHVIVLHLLHTDEDNCLNIHAYAGSVH